MNDVIIKVDTPTGKAYCENNKIGVKHANLQNKIIFEMDNKIEGVAWLEYEVDSKKYWAEMEETEAGYQIDIKSCLLVSNYVNVDLKITENENANGIPIFVSTITTLDVYDSIGASDEEPEEYPSWLDNANAKLAEMSSLEDTVSTNEASRTQNETTRQSNETTRINNEITRVSNENERISAENTRNSNETTRINNDAARETRISNLETYKADKTEIPNVSNFITKDVNNLTNYTLKTSTGSLIDLSINGTTYVVTLQLKDVDGNVISSDTIDLPLENVVVSGSFDKTTKKIILTLENGSEVDFSVADLVAGLQTEITITNKLASDLIDDSNSGNKFVSTSEKTSWNSKLDSSDLDDYVKNSDYATSNTGGVIKSGAYGVNIDSLGRLNAQGINYNNYVNATNNTFIGKQTLENVIAGKELVNKTYVDNLIGDIETILTTLDTGNGV